MKLGYFIGFLYAHEIQFFQILIIISCIYFVLLRNKYFSILDPIFLQFFASVISTSVVVVLFINSIISYRYFSHYILSVFAFYFSFIVFSKSKNNYAVKKRKLLRNKKYLYNTPYYFWIIFIILSIIDIISQLYIYNVAGIPLFKQSRLEIFRTGGGIGLISRIQDVTKIISYYLMFFFIFQNNYKHKKYASLYLIFTIVVFFFSGSKMGILILLQVWAVFVYINKEQFQNAFYKYKKHIVVYLIIGVIITFTIISIQNNDKNISSVLMKLYIRMIAFGDIYFYAYPNNVIEQIPTSNELLVIFGDLLRTIRLVPEEWRPPAIGFLISDAVYHTNGAISGPNPRISIYSYVHFGYWGGIIFSFVGGLLIGKSRKALEQSIQSSQWKKIIFFFLYFKIVVIETDPSMVIRSLITNMLTIGIMYLVILFLVIMVRNRKDNKSLSSYAF